MLPEKGASLNRIHVANAQKISSAKLELRTKGAKGKADWQTAGSRKRELALQAGAGSVAADRSGLSDGWAPGSGNGKPKREAESGKLEARSWKSKREA
jgi:hypothetical protein